MVYIPPWACQVPLGVYLFQPSYTPGGINDHGHKYTPSGMQRLTPFVLTTLSRRDPNTVTRSPSTSTRRWCWCAARVNGPRMPRKLCATPAWPRCTSSGVGSLPGRNPDSRSTGVRNAGIWNVKSVSSQARWCCRASWAASPSLDFKWLAAGIGAGLAGAALTNTCAMGMALSRLPYNRVAHVDVQTIVANLIASTPEPRRRGA